MLHCWYSYALVYLCWTFGTRMLYFSGTVIRKSLQWLFCRPNVPVVYRSHRYEILSVHLCCTVGARVMHLWCQGAAHFYWHYYLYFEITNCDLKRVLLIIVSKDNANRRQNNKLA